MKRKKYTIRQIQDMVECDGLPVVLANYISPNEIENEDLSYLWQTARECLDAITTYLGADPYSLDDDTLEESEDYEE